MSKVTALQFLSEAYTNPSLKTQIEQVKTTGDLLKIAKGQGYDFTADEVKAAAETAKSGELSEDELEAVAGGKGGKKSSSGSSFFFGGVSSQAIDANVRIQENALEFLGFIGALGA